MNKEDLNLKIAEIHTKYVNAAKHIASVKEAIKSVHTNDDFNTESINASKRLREAVIDINHLSEAINTDFIQEVEYLIKTTYNLQFPGIGCTPEGRDTSNFIVDPQVILNHIQEHCGDYTLGGVEQAKRDLKWNISSAECKNNKVEFSELFYIDDFWSKHYNKISVSYNSTKYIINLFRLLSYAETSTIQPLSEFDKINLRELTKDAYILESTSKIDSLKFFKNGKVSVIFKTKELATEFYKLIRN
jgi:hypothetical protein